MTDHAYVHHEFYIPERMIGGLRRYVDNRIPPGDFLQAVICNDLVEACGRADAENARNLPAYVAWLYNEAPRPCWGSRDAMEAWLKGPAT